MTSIRPDVPGPVSAAPLGAPGPARPAEAPVAPLGPESAGAPAPAMSGSGADHASAATVRRAELFRVASSIDQVQRGGLALDRADAALRAIRDRLDELGTLTASTRRALGAQESDRAEVQSRIDALLGEIQQAADEVGGATVARAGAFPALTAAVRAEDVSAQVEKFNANAVLAPGERLNVDVQITAPAERAGLFLSLGGLSLNLGGPGGNDGEASLLFLELAGPSGSTALSFSSGATIENVAAVINALTNTTGLTARVSGTGVRLDTRDFGSDSFLSVRVVDGADLSQSTSTGGVYRLGPGAAAADPAQGTAWSQTDALVRDEGADIAGTINGLAAVGRGRSLAVETQTLRVALLLREGAAAPGQVSATQAVTFRALTLLRPGPEPGPQATGNAGAGEPAAGDDALFGAELVEAARRAATSIDSSAQGAELGTARGSAELRLAQVEATRAAQRLALGSLNEQLARAVLGGSGAGQATTPQRVASLLAGTRSAALGASGPDAPR